MNALRPFWAILILGLMLACTPPPLRRTKGEGKAPPKKKVIKAIALNDTIIKAYKAYAHCYYDIQLFHDGYRQKAGKLVGPTKVPNDKELEALQGREAKARIKLSKAVGESDFERALRVFFKSLTAAPRLFAIADQSKGRLPSFLVVKAKNSGSDRSSKFFDKEISYHVVVYDSVLVEDFSGYRARKIASRPPFQAVRVVSRSYYLDGASLSRLGRVSFWKRLSYYQKVRAQLGQKELFTGLEKKPTELLRIAKDGLRSRSLRALEDAFKKKTPAEQDQAFVKDYVDRSLVRAAAAHYEHQRFTDLKDKAPSKEQRRLLEEFSFYTAMIHGDPLGVLATVFGLARQQLPYKRAITPEHVSALAITVALKNSQKALLPKDPKRSAETSDALALYLLCNATPRQLKDLARAKLAQRRLQMP